MTRPVSNAWGLGPAGPTEPSSTRIPELVLFACVPLSTLRFGGLPLNELAVLAMLALAATRRGRGQARLPYWVITLLLAIPALILLSSMMNEISPTKRLVHLASWCVLALFLSSGRIHAPSAVRGLAVGLLLAVLAFFAGVNSGYEGRLTGLFGDPNNAGFYLSVCGLLAFALIRAKGWRLAVFGLAVAGVVATQSRTSLMALALATAWALLTPHLPRLLSVLAGAACFVGVSRLPRDLFLSAYADRSGSDLLRVRILALEEAKVQRHPWFGGGGGTATVKIGDLDFFFHSSYLAVRQEGGWVALGVVVGLVCGLLVFSAGLPRRSRVPWVESSLVAVLVCAVNLGEVFFELPTAIAVGVTLWCWRVAREPGEPWQIPGVLPAPLGGGQIEVAPAKHGSAPAADGRRPIGRGSAELVRGAVR